RARIAKERPSSYGVGLDPSRARHARAHARPVPPSRKTSDRTLLGTWLPARGDRRLRLAVRLATRGGARATAIAASSERAAGAPDSGPTGACTTTPPTTRASA